MRRLVLSVVLCGFVGSASYLRAELIYAVTSAGFLVRFQSAAPGTVTGVGTITGLQGGETILGIDFRPATGQLYGLGSTSRLYVINTTTATATQVGSGTFTPALSGTSFGFDFNPVVDRIRVVSDADQNVRLNPDTGAAVATDTNLAYAVGDPNAGANPNVVGSAYSNNLFSATSTTLFGIDSNLDVLVRQGSVDGTPVSPNTGQLFTVGALGVNANDVVGFDVSGATGVAYASLCAIGGPTCGLYTISLVTGAATLVGGIAVGPMDPTDSPVRAIAVAGGGTAANVPTLSGWLLGVLAVAIAIGGLFVLRGSSATG
jgi:hypothetical protein